MALTPPQAPSGRRRRALLECGHPASPDPMPDAQLPDHAELVAELQGLEAGLEPCELHGSLCGYLSGGGKHDRRTWFAQVMADPLLSAPEAEGALDRLLEEAGVLLVDVATR